MCRTPEKTCFVCEEQKHVVSTVEHLRMAARPKHHVQSVLPPDELQTFKLLARSSWFCILYLCSVYCYYFGSLNG
jgi:hypothetical protein